MLLAGWINQFILAVAAGSGHWSTSSSTTETKAKGDQLALGESSI